MAIVVKSEEAELTEEIHELTAVNCAVAVLSDTDYDLAGDFLNELKTTEKRANEYWSPVVKAAHEAHKAIKAKQNEMVKPIQEARKAIGAEMGRYQDKLEAERKEEEAVAHALDLANAKAEQKEYADNLREMGHDTAAEALLSREPVVAPVVESFAPKVEGTTRRKTWNFEIVDATLVPDTYRVIDEKAIAQHAKSRKENASIPGVRFYSITNVS